MPVREIGVVGDDPVVETLMARRGGATAFGVTTGVTTIEDWMRQPPARRAHRVLGDLRDVLGYVVRRDGREVTGGRERPLRRGTRGVPVSIVAIRGPPRDETVRSHEHATRQARARRLR